jgi:hypothetical protein
MPFVSTDYVTEPPSDSDYLPDGVVCSQSFIYRLKDTADTVHNPSEISIDSNSGLVTLTNKATVKTTYEIEIDNTTTDGTNPRYLTVAGISINIVCGPASTTPTPPSMDNLYQVPNLPDRLKIDEVFIPTNELCPIESHVLVDNIGDEHYNFTVREFIMPDLGEDVD